MPTWRATAAVVAALSPESREDATPRAASSDTASAAEGSGWSCNDEESQDPACRRRPRRPCLRPGRAESSLRGGDGGRSGAGEPGRAHEDPLSAPSQPRADPVSPERLVAARRRPPDAHTQRGSRGPAGVRSAPRRRWRGRAGRGASTGAPGAGDHVDHGHGRPPPPTVLVQDDARDRPGGLEGRRVAHDDARSRRSPQGDGERERSRQAQRAGTGDDEDGDRRQKRLCGRTRRDPPGREARRGRQDDDGREDRGGAVRQALHRRLGRERLLDERRDLRETGGAAPAASLDRPARRR